MIENISKKVVKFGGSSLSSAKQFKKVSDIVLSDPTRCFVIPSAPGKRDDFEEKVTDMLIECHRLASDGREYLPIFEKIKARFNEIIRGLELNITLDNEFSVIEEWLQKGCTRDYVASRGEYLNGILLSQYIGFTFIDAAEVIMFDKNGIFDSNKTNIIMSERLANEKSAVIPGFYGSLPSGEIKTFSRGGSDITGAIVARAVLADLYENWTDVSGFLMCDPRIVKDPKAIHTITYRELRELSYMGATVLHEDSIFPVKHAGIPINIRNTNRPDDEGTFIIPNERNYKDTGIITGIAGKKGFAVLHIEKDMMNNEIGFGMRVLKVLADMGLSFEHFPSGIDTMSLIINGDEIHGKEKKLLAEISRTVNPDNVSLETGMSLIAIVGRGMINAPGTASRIFSAIAQAGVNIRMIDQGSSELNIIVGVDELSFGKAIRAIYDEFAE
ncbi:MAG: aspartate kinase [Clostridia bacterium]